MNQPEAGSTDMTEYHPNSSPKTLSREKKCSLLKRRGIFDIRKMSEGRKTQVVLLDDRRLDLLVKPKLYSTELLDIVASHFNLKEKEYFGLSFKDDTGHHHWLHRDRKVLEHEFSKKSSSLVLYFGIRFFIESIGYLREKYTIELFFQQAKQAVFKGQLEVDTDTVFELAAHVLQATYGDHVDDVTARKQLKKLPVLPTSALRDHPSLGYCEDQVLAHYRKLEGYTRGSAIVNYMTIIESVPTYGIHYYEVKDKGGIPWWLGLSHKGIALYDYADKRVPRRVFAWKQLENLYFRDKKFSIEVHDPKRVVHTLSSFNLYEDAIQEPLEEFDELSDAISDPTTQVSVSRRTFGPGNVNVHAWLASTPLLTKCIWSMAVSQHQFYLDRKQSKSQLPQVRSMSEIATDLSHSSSSLHSSAANSDNISRSNSAHSLTLSTYNSRTELTAEDLEASRAAHTEMFQALKARKDALEEALRKKKEELKSICLKEGELTGVLPQETPLAPGEPVPQIRRRVGTSFALSPKVMNRDKASEAEEALAQLELDFELQDKICKAAYKLAQDKSVAKSVRKQRKSQYHKSHQRLKNIEKKLNEYRQCVGKIPVKVQSSMEDDLSEDSREFLDTEPGFVSPIRSPSLNRQEGREVPFQYPTYHGNRQSSTQEQVLVTQPQHKSAPASPVRQPHGVPRVSTPSPNPGRHYQGGGGYIPNSVYSTRMQYRSQMYPTYSTKDGPATGSQSDYENTYTSAPPPQAGPTLNRHVSRIDQEGYSKEHVNNLYNVNTNKVTSYDSTDELKSPLSEDCDSSDQEYGGRWHGPYHGEVGEMQPRAYGSLDRNAGSNIPLQELSPSKFGSKRESHSDYRDSPFQIIDMPPPPTRTLNDVRGYRGMHHYDRGPPEDPAAPRDDNTSHNDSIPYIDCSQSSISLASNIPGTPWYDPKEPIRQHGVNVHSQYESQVTPGYVPEPSPSGYERVPGCCDLPLPRGHNSQNPPSGKPVTVSKYQSYVEVSKPFEMSDFYKYSERFRKQRVKESPPSSAGDGSNPQSPHHTPSQPSYPAPHPQQSQGSSRVHSFSGQTRSSYVPPHSGVSGYSSSSSRSRPSSPFSQQRYPPQQPQQQQQPEGHSYPPSQHPSSPYQSVSPTSGAQSSLVQTSHHHVHMGQQSSVPYQSVHQSPKHVAYQPPKPMTCEPIRDSQNHSSMASKNATHRQV